MSVLPPDLVSRLVATQPLPVADALSLLAGAESAHEQRDRVVECFRASLRYCATVVLAVRVQYGEGPDGENEQPAEFLRTLRQRGLTDGQWIGITRELLRAWRSQPGAYPVPGLVELFHGRAGKGARDAFDGLLEMRKSETVAHGRTGTRAEIEDVLEGRLPQLEALLSGFAPIWEAAPLLVPLAKPEPGERQRGWLLMRATPPRGKWPRTDFAAGVHLPPGGPVLTDQEGQPRVALAPVAQFLRPTPEAIEEFFALDRGKRGGAIFVALPSMAEHRAEEVWGDLERALLGHAVREEAPLEETGGLSQPYRGLESFGPEHAMLFFGREKEAETIANRIRRHPFLTLFGPSGSGKTSLLRAGVLPKFGEQVESVVLRPGRSPVQALRRQLASVLGRWGAGSAEAELEKVLASHPERLGALLDRLARASDGGQAQPLGDLRMILVVDQAEELFTLCNDNAERGAFAAAVVSAGANADGPLRVVLSVREDFFGRLATVPALHGVYSRETHALRTPEQDDLHRILVEPARRFGYTFEDQALVDAMLAGVAGESAALVLLQFCADRMWEQRDRSWKRLTRRAYEAHGGVEGALASHAESVLQLLSARQQELVRSMMLRLVSEEGTRAVMPRAELLEGVGGGPEAEQVLDRLVAARLLTVRGDESDNQVVELVHEALLTRWERLRSWLDEDSEMVRARARVATATRRWEREGRNPDFLLNEGRPLEEAEALLRDHCEELNADQRRFVVASIARKQRRLRVRRFFVTALAALAVAASVLGLLAVQGERRANLQTQVAEEQTRLAEEQARRAVEEARRARDHQRLSVARGQLDTSPTHAVAILREVEDPSAVIGWLATASASLTGTASRPVFEVSEPGYALVGVSEPFSPDGSQVVTIADDGTARIWQVDGTKGGTLLKGHEERVTSASFSPDGSRIVTASEDGTVRVWQTDGRGSALVLEGIRSHRASASFSHDGRRVAAASEDGLVRVWQVDGSIEPVVLSAPHRATGSVSFSPDGRRVIASAGAGRVVVWSSTGEGAPVVLEGCRSTIFDPTHTSFSSDGSRVIVISNGCARVWKVEGDEGPVDFEHERSNIRTASFSADGDWVVTAAGDRTARVWRADGSGEPVVLTGHGDSVLSASFSPEGSRVVTASLDGTARVWQADGTGEPVILAGAGQMRAASFSPDGLRVLTTSTDGAVQLWRVGSVQEPVILSGHTGPLLSAAFSPDGHQVMTASVDHTARVWWADGSGDPVVLLHDAVVRSAAFSPDGSRVVTEAGDTARVWHANGTGNPVILARGSWFVSLSPDWTRLLRVQLDDRVWVLQVDGKSKPARLAGHSGHIGSAAFSPDGSRVVTASQDGTARVWRGDGRGPSVVLRGEWSSPDNLVASFSPDGTRVLVHFHRTTVHLWNADGVGQPVVFQGRVFLKAAAFSPDGERVATAMADGTVLVWRADGAGEPVVLAGGGSLSVETVSFSPDSRRIVAGSAGGTAHIWRIDGTGGPVVLAGHNGPVVSAAFSPDGRRVVTASQDGTARVWSVASDLLMERLWAATSYCLSVEERFSLLGVSEDEAVEQIETCRARVAEARSALAEQMP